MSGFNIYLVWTKLCVSGAFLVILLYVFHEVALDFNKKNVNLNVNNVSSLTRVLQSKEFNANKQVKIRNINSRTKQKKILTAGNNNLRQFKKAVFSQRNENIRNMFLNRTKRLQNACQQYKSYITNNDFFLPKAYSLEPLEKLAICRTAKHGSTTWAKNFIHIYLG